MADSHMRLRVPMAGKKALLFTIADQGGNSILAHVLTAASPNRMASPSGRKRVPLLLI